LSVLVQIMEPVGRRRHAGEAVRRRAWPRALIVGIGALDHGLAVSGDVERGGESRRPVVERIALDAREAAGPAELTLLLDERWNVGVIVIESQSQVEGQPISHLPLVVDEAVAIQTTVWLIDREVERLNFDRLMR